MLKTEEIQINGNCYQVKQLGAKQGRQVLFRLTKAVGPALLAMPAALTGGSTAGLASALQSIQPEDFDYLCDVFAQSSTVSIRSTAHGADPFQSPHVSVAAVFDQHFAGRYAELVEWLVFCARINFADFFSGMAARLAKSQLQNLSSSEPPASPKA